MKIIPVYLRDMQDAKHLVQAAEACKKEVDLLCGRYVVDAKFGTGKCYQNGGKLRWN